MKIVFVSNFMNHHQLPLSYAIINLGIEYKFIATEPIPKERLDMGYKDMNNEYDFVICAYENDDNYKKALNLCFNADVVIVGSSPKVYIKERLKAGKLTFKYSERIYKIKPPLYQMPLRAIKYFLDYGRYKSFYMLCASAYSAADYAKTGTFLNKTYKWGYFPEVKKYDNINDLINKKTANSLLWAGRLIDWKHPENAIEIARRLKQDGYNFIFNMIGTGDLKEYLETLIADCELQNYVRLLGSMSPEKVRDYMEKSQVYLFTSNRQEGWGAVLNEAMNSGCAVVASHEIGSVPFLIENGKNGLIYRDGDIDDLYKKVKYLLDNSCERYIIGEKAYYTLESEWNAENATKRLIKLFHSLLDKQNKIVFENGICSNVEIIKDNWLDE